MGNSLDARVPGAQARSRKGSRNPGVQMILYWLQGGGSWVTLCLSLSPLVGALVRVWRRAVITQAPGFLVPLQLGGCLAWTPVSSRGWGKGVAGTPGPDTWVLTPFPAARPPGPAAPGSR